MRPKELVTQCASCAVTTSAGVSAILRAVALSAAQTMTRIIGSVPRGAAARGRYRRALTRPRSGNHRVAREGVVVDAAHVDPHLRKDGLHEGSTVVLAVDLVERAGNREAHRTGLARGATAVIFVVTL